MLTPTKTKEKPSIVSKKVIKTHHKNGTESFLLTEKIKTLEHKQSQKNIDIDLEVNALKKKIEAVQRVKEKISLSKERRMLLKSQGFTIRVCKGKAEEDIILRRDSLQVEAGNWATLLASPPDFAAAHETSELQNACESRDDCSSPSESRSNGRMRSLSFSSVADSRSKQVPRYRVIEPPLRPGSRRGFSLVSTTPTLKTDDEMRQELNDELSMPSSGRVSSRWDAIRNRPLSGRSLFVDAVIAARDSKGFANNQNAAQSRMNEYWRNKYIIGRRTKSATAKVRSTTTAEQPVDNEELKTHVKKHLCNLKLDEVVGLTEQEQETPEKKKASESNLISHGLRKLNEDQQYGLCLPSGSTNLTLFTSKANENDASTNKYSRNSVRKEEKKDLKVDRNMESNNVVNRISMNNDHKPNERSKSANKSNELPPLQTSNISNVEVEFDVLNPVLLNEQEVAPSEEADVYESCLESKQDKFADDSDTAVQESSGKTHLALPDKISRMSIRRHSADGEINNGSGFHGNDSKSRAKYSNKDAAVKVHVTLPQPNSSKHMNRKMSHPPRLMGIVPGDEKPRKRKPLKNVDEVVYAYDARPDKSLSKGYRVMQMTVGGRQVKLNMAAFPKQSGSVNADRARIRTKLSSIRGKSKEFKQSKES